MSAGLPPDVSVNRTIAASGGTYQHEPHDWGSVTWYVSADQISAESLCVGRLTVAPGQEVPIHRHPGFEQVLHVLAGTVQHTVERGREIRQKPGDTLTVPAGVPHSHRNLGTTELELLVVCASPGCHSEAGAGGGVAWG